MSDQADDPALLESLSERLLEAHRRVRQLDVDEDEKARSTRRLLAISEAAKHDVRRASVRLDALVGEWDAAVTPPAAGGNAAR